MHTLCVMAHTRPHTFVLGPNFLSAARPARCHCSMHRGLERPRPLSHKRLSDDGNFVLAGIMVQQKWSKIWSKNGVTPLSF